MPKVQNQIYVRPPWERMMRFYNLVQNQEYANCTTLAREFEVSVRTIKRDLDFMKYRMDLPLKFDGQRPGARPRMNCDPGESPQQKRRTSCGGGL